MSSADLKVRAAFLTINPGSMNFLGAWSAAASYKYADCVIAGGDLYICINQSGSVNQNPATTPAVWEILAGGPAGSGVFYPDLTQDLGGSSGTFGVINLSKTNAFLTETDEIKLRPGSLAPGIQIADDLVIDAGKKIDFLGEAKIDSAVEVRLDAPAYKMVNLPAAGVALPNVMSYDPATNAITYQAAGGGGGGVPGGANTNVQYNNGGAFAGSGNFTWNNGTNTLGATNIESSQLLAVDATSYVAAGVNDNRLTIGASGIGANNPIVQFVNPTSGNDLMMEYDAAGTLYVVNSGAADTISLQTGDLTTTGDITCAQLNYTTLNPPIVVPPAVVPAGANTEVQFNNSGAFGASSNLTFNSGTQTLTTTTFSGKGVSLTPSAPGDPTIGISTAANGMAISSTSSISGIAGYIDLTDDVEGTITIGPPSIGIIKGANVSTLSDTTLQVQNIANATALTINTPALSITTLPAATTSDVVFYDSGSGALSYGTAPTTAPAGAGTEIQYNNGLGGFGASPNLTFNASTQILSTTEVDAARSLYTAVGSAGQIAVNMNANQLQVGAVGFANDPTILMTPNSGLGSSIVVDNATAGFSVLNGWGAINLTANSGINLTGPSLSITTLPNATTSDVMYYDSATKAVSYGAAPATAPAGANTELQFNNSGAFGADASLTFNSGTQTLNAFAVATESVGLVGTGPLTGFITTIAPNETIVSDGLVASKITPTNIECESLTLINPNNATTADVLYYNTLTNEVSYGTAPAATAPAGANTEIQFNNAGAFGADQGLSYTTNNLKIGNTGVAAVPTLTFNNNAGNLSVISEAATGDIEVAPSAGAITRIMNGDLEIVADNLEFSGVAPQITNPVLIRGKNNTDMTLQAKGTGDLVFQTETGGVDTTALTIADATQQATFTARINGTEAQFTQPGGYVAVNNGNRVSIGGVGYGGNPSVSLIDAVAGSSQVYHDNATSRLNLDCSNGVKVPNGVLEITNSVYPIGGIRDSTNVLGTSGQFLTSTGTGIAWATQFRPTFDYYVAPNGSDITGDGSYAKPWGTIQNAINQTIAVRGSLTQVVVHLAAGHYTENLTITKAYIAFVADLNGASLNEITEITGDISINLSSGTPADLFNAQIIFQGILLTTGTAAGGITDITATYQHTIVFENCFIFASGRGYFQNSSVNTRSRILNTQIKHSATAASANTLVEIASGFAIITNSEITSDIPQSGVANVGGLTIRASTNGALSGVLQINRCVITNDNTGAGTIGPGALIRLDNASTGHSAGYSQFLYSAAAAKTNANGNTPIYGATAGTALTMTNSLFVPGGLPAGQNVLVLAGAGTSIATYLNGSITGAASGFSAGLKNVFTTCV